jgi:hypothetical protein
MQRARSIARRHGMESVIVAARNGDLPKRYAPFASPWIDAHKSLDIGQLPDDATHFSLTFGS